MGALGRGGHNLACNGTHCLLGVGGGATVSGSKKKHGNNTYKVTIPNNIFQNFIFMGDFNAGCSYVPKKAWKNIRLRTDTRFVWLIGDQEDTTVKGSTSCAYDR